jgi:fluoride exporter
MVGGYLIVFAGGGVGAALRHSVNRASLAYFGPGFPYGTLLVNIVGGLLMGVLAELFLAKGVGSQEFRLFLTTGVLGGFTTFSAFSLEAALMWQRSDYAALATYIAASVLLSIGALFLGMASVRALT